MIPQAGSHGRFEGKRLAVRGIVLVTAVRSWRMREYRWMHLGDAAVRLAWRLLWSWRRKDPPRPTL